MAFDRSTCQIEINQSVDVYIFNAQKPEVFDKESEKLTVPCSHFNVEVSVRIDYRESGIT